MYRSKPTAGIGDETIVAAVTGVVMTVLAVLAGALRRSHDAAVRAEQWTATPSPTRPPAAATTALGGGSA